MGDARLAMKYGLQHAITPLLRRRAQQRVAIIHEVLPHEQRVVRALLTSLDATPEIDVTVTFDDGFVSSYEAIRSLTSHKAIFFVCPAYIACGERGGWESFFRSNFRRTERLDDATLRAAVRPVTWAQLRELVALGHTIGSHAMTHARLSSLRTRREREWEIRASADRIEDQLGVPVRDFSYPFGDLSSIDADALACIRTRYDRCFSGIRGNNANAHDRFLRWRDTVHLYWTASYNHFLLRGGFDLAYVQKRRAMVSLAHQTR